MKKILALLLAIIMLVCMCACGSESENNATDENPNAEVNQGVSSDINENKEPDAAGSDGTENTQPAETDADSTEATESVVIPTKKPSEDGLVDPELDPDKDPAKPETTNPQPTEPVTEPSEPEPTKPTESNKPDLSMTYEEFQNLTPAQMRAFEESFESKDAFFEWYNAAKDAYEKANPPIDAGNGTITLPTD